MSYAQITLEIAKKAKLSDEILNIDYQNTSTMIYCLFK